MISVPDIHHRHSIRLKGYDYGQAGAYFITICAWQRQCLFGEIVNGRMVLSNKGRVVAEEWAKTETIRENVILDEFVVMPNHFHAIMFFPDHVGVMPQQRATHRVAPTGPRSGSIGAIMAQFKSIVTKYINNKFCDKKGRSVWQRNYYERVISALQIIFLFFYKKIICERHLSRSSRLEMKMNCPEPVNISSTIP